MGPVRARSKIGHAHVKRTRVQTTARATTEQCDIYSISCVNGIKIIAIVRCRVATRGTW